MWSGVHFFTSALRSLLPLGMDQNGETFLACFAMLRNTCLSQAIRQEPKWSTVIQWRKDFKTVFLVNQHLNWCFWGKAGLIFFYKNIMGFLWQGKPGSYFTLLEQKSSWIQCFLMNKSGATGRGIGKRLWSFVKQNYLKRLEKSENWGSPLGLTFVFSSLVYKLVCECVLFPQTFACHARAMLFLKQGRH